MPSYFKCFQICDLIHSLRFHISEYQLAQKPVVTESVFSGLFFCRNHIQSNFKLFPFMKFKCLHFSFVFGDNKRKTRTFCSSQRRFSFPFERDNLTNDNFSWVFHFLSLLIFLFFRLSASVSFINVPNSKGRKKARNIFTNVEWMCSSIFECNLWAVLLHTERFGCNFPTAELLHFITSI